MIRATGLSPLAQAILIGSEEGEYSAPIDLLSAADTSTQAEAPGADRRIAAGYDQLAIALARELAVFVEQPVSRIEWGDGVRVHHAAGVIEADAVIVTVSVAVLQSGSITFDPPLPAEKTDAIDGLGMGRLGKIIAVYDDPPWGAETSGVLHDGLVTTWWMPGLNREGGPNDTVIGFASERFAAAVEGLPASEIRAVALRELVEIFGSNAEAPARFRYQAWHENPWIGGGYSYVRVGRAGSREGLGAPLRSEVFFAGEATHPTTPATTHGAIESGRRAADEVSATLSNRTAPKTSRPASHALATRTPLIR